MAWTSNTAWRLQNCRPVKTRLLELVQELGKLARQHGAWVRLHYVYPYPSVDDILPLMAQGWCCPTWMCRCSTATPMCSSA